MGSVPWVNVMGMDPGTHYLGLSVACLDIQAMKIAELHSKTIVLDQLVINKHIVASHSHQFARLHALGLVVQEEFRIWDIACLFCESPYYSHKTPTAFGPLTATVTTVRHSLAAYDPTLAMVLLSPSQIKNVVGASGGAKKPEVLEAMKLILGQLPLVDDLNDLGPDAIDSLAATLAGCVELGVYRPEIKPSKKGKKK